jgi:hypothetical protein
MFRSFNSKNAEGETTLFVDIGADRVAASLIHIPRGGKPFELYSEEQHISLRFEGETKDALAIVAGTLEEVLAKIQTEGLPVLREQGLMSHGKLAVYTVNCFFSSPWFVSQTRSIKIHNDKPMPLTRPMLDKIVASERQSFNANVRSGTYAQNFKENVVVVEAKTMDVTLNGYRLNNPFGKPANDIVITLYLSVVGDALVQTIKQTVGNVLSYGRIMFHTAPLVLQAAVRELPHATSDFLIMDMSGETTDIIISKKDSIVETVTMPIGTMFFVRKISKAMSISPQLALSYLRMAAQEKLDDAMYTKVCQHMKAVSKEWVELFHEALKQASAEVLIPRTIFLVTDVDFATILTDVLSGDELEQLILSSEKFRIETLNPDDVREFYGHHSPLIRDPLRILESYFINKLKSL